MITGLIVLATLIGASLLPIGLRVSYDGNDPLLQLKVGPFFLKLYPRSRTLREKKVTQSMGKSGTTASNNSTKSSGGISDLLPILRVVWELLQDFKRKLLVERLEFKMVLAGSDPCDLSVNYGRAWVTLGNLMPQLENNLNIRKRNLEIECDYLADQTKVFLLADLTMSVGQLLALAARHGLRGLIEYRKLLKIKKGGA